MWVAEEFTNPPEADPEGTSDENFIGWPLTLDGYPNKTLEEGC
jgi:hypothetical protein